MNTTNTILIQEEPAVFDAANVMLSAKWLDWYLTKYVVDIGEAVAKGQDKLKEMVDHLTYLSTVECGEPRYASTSAQLIELIEGIQCYRRCFTLLNDINENGWLGYIKDGDPSVFATSGDGVNIRAWLAGVVREHKLAPAHMQTLAGVIIGSLKKVDEAAYKKRFASKRPSLSSSVPGLPTLAWVLNYSLKQKVSLEQAHIMCANQLRELDIGKV